MFLYFVRKKPYPGECKSIRQEIFCVPNTLFIQYYCNILKNQSQDDFLRKTNIFVEKVQFLPLFFPKLEKFWLFTSNCKRTFQGGKILQGVKPGKRLSDGSCRVYPADFFKYSHVFFGFILSEPCDDICYLSPEGVFGSVYVIDTFMGNVDTDLSSVNAVCQL